MKITGSPIVVLHIAAALRVMAIHRPEHVTRPWALFQLSQKRRQRAGANGPIVFADEHVFAEFLGSSGILVQRGRARWVLMIRSNPIRHVGHQRTPRSRWPNTRWGLHNVDGVHRETRNASTILQDDAILRMALVSAIPNFKSVKGTTRTVPSMTKWLGAKLLIY